MYPGLRPGAQSAMHRRLLIAVLGCWPVAGLLAQDEPPRPHQKISANELRKSLMARFPVDLAVPGLFDVRLDARDLLLLPARQRLGATLVARLADLSARRVYPGELDLTFAVRYEGSDQTLRAHDLAVPALRSPDLPPQSARAWQALLDNVVRGNVDEVVLHRFTPGELQLSDLLGFQPQKITVEDDGVEIWFEPKPLRPSRS